ncbi:MAG: glycerophosphodiester phosphodiesterase [Deltaproteobacteria bacterium]|nr:glycerophosphodiester phosphodiesterase [Deltaproteobacteria bacterium]
MSHWASILRGGPVPPWLLARPIAHRGLHDAVHPENSVAAFEAAAEAGLPIELDVQRTHDGGAVVFHDEALSRLTGQPGQVTETSQAELEQLPLLGTSQTIPSLDRVLAVVDDRVPIVVEIKASGPRGALERVVRDALRRRPGRYVVQSFDPWSLVWMRRHAPEIPRGMLSTDFRDDAGLPRYQEVVLEHLMMTPWVRPHYVGYDLRALPHPAPSQLRAAGVPLLAWTVRDAAQLARARSLADNVIFEGVEP